MKSKLWSLLSKVYKVQIQESHAITIASSKLVSDVLIGENFFCMTSAAKHCYICKHKKEQKWWKGDQNFFHIFENQASNKISLWVILCSKSLNCSKQPPLFHFHHPMTIPMMCFWGPCNHNLLFAITTLAFLRSYESGKSPKSKTLDAKSKQFGHCCLNAATPTILTFFYTSLQALINYNRHFFFQVFFFL